MMKMISRSGKCGMKVVKFMSVFLVLSFLLWVLLVFTDEARNLYFKFQKEDNNDDEKSCVSRQELPLYWRGEAHKPSPHLISKLESYEARHRRCGPHTHSYAKTVAFLESNHNSTDSDCKYVVWVPRGGMGNKMLTIASAFLYALLTDRVLLLHRGKDMPGLFCNPFPNASWFLPSNFPLANHFDSFNQNSKHCFGNLLNTNVTLHPYPYVYLNLLGNYRQQDQFFFCDQDQTNLQHIPWLIMRSDLYFVPSLFMMPMFQQQLHALFPQTDTVFHLLGRYLFHPSDLVWELVSRYYQDYLSKADLRVGIQVRVFDKTGPFTQDQILACTKRGNILPQINTGTVTNNTNSTVAVVMASLWSSYYKRIRDMYKENPRVRVFQPSHEEHQKKNNENHDKKALAEIYMLSLADKLVTSGWSTFGYVGASLGGVKAWIMTKPVNRSVPEPPCVEAMSMEPCFHVPPYYDCKRRTGVDPGYVVPHVKHCEDFTWGIKLL